jgi:hypothetical protein
MSGKVIGKQDVTDIAVEETPRRRREFFSPQKDKPLQIAPKPDTSKEAEPQPPPSPLPKQTQTSEEIDSFSGTVKQKLLAICQRTDAAAWTKEDAIKIAGLLMEESINEGKAPAAKGYFELILKMRGFTDKNDFGGETDAAKVREDEEAHRIVMNAHKRFGKPGHVRDIATGEGSEENDED